MTTETTPSVTASVQVTARPFNPFDYVANILMAVRMKLEENSQGDDVPRYARIAQANEASIELFKTLGKGGVLGLTLTVSKMVHLTLLAKDLFGDLRSMKALIEVAGAMVKAVSEPQFTASISVLFNNAGGGGTSLQAELSGINSGAVNEFIDKMEKFMDFIPDPDDLSRIEYELFMMARVTYSYHDLFLSGSGNPSVGYPVQEETGKVRLLQWTFDCDWDVDYKGGVSHDSKHAGKRVPVDGRRGGAQEIRYEDVLIYKYINAFTDDLTDIGEMFQKLGYPRKADTVIHKDRKAIRIFQRANELPITGIIDNDVINRLFNLDFENQGLQWAVRYDANKHTEPDEEEMDGCLRLINGDANGYDEEGYTPALKGKYHYYIIGHDRNTSKPKGWTSVPALNNIGFLALEGRERERDADPFYEGGSVSEGPAQCGKQFFFAAMHTQPWIAGRRVHPGGSENLFGFTLADDSSKTVGLEPKMYQSVNLLPIQTLATSDAYTGFKSGRCKLEISVYAKQRFLYNDKVNMSVPDQGRIRLEVIREGENDPVATNDPQWWPQPKDFRSLSLKRAQALENKQEYRHDKHNFWECLQTVPVLLDNSILGTNQTQFSLEKYSAKVTLEGKLNNNWDCDAYFTDVVLKWRIVPVEAGS